MNTDILNRLHKIAMFFEDDGNELVADELHNIFVKLSAKKKKSKKKGNKPNDPALYSRCKAEIKRKFDVYPSAYANMALVKLYKSRGGTYRSE
jgi:hypothetical protein